MKKRQEVLFTQLETYRYELLDLVEDLSEEEADKIPKGFRNNIRWNLGHIYLDQILWIEAITREKSPESSRLNKWFGFGTNPSNFSNETPSLQELKILLKQQPLQIKERYGDQLEVEYEPTEMGMYTLEQVLIRTIYHEGLHTATIMNIMRFL